jgi:Holliday junction resolvase
MNSKKKGNHWENAWANWLRDHGIRAWKDGGSGGGNREKSDVGNNVNANFEVKAVKALNLKKAWKQSCAAASLSHNTPYVVVHFDGMAENDYLVIMSNHDWLELASDQKTKIKLDPAIHKNNNREVTWAIAELRRAAAKVDKLLTSTDGLV